MILGFVPLVLVWSLDWFSKKWAMSLGASHDFGLIHFELVYNHGVMLGISSELPLLVKTVTLTTLGAMILSSYATVLSFVPIKSLSLRLGLSTLVGGIMGNVTDRFIHSAVIDFIAIKFNHHITTVINVADICQWIGYVFIAYGLYQDSRYYWPTIDLRNTFFINPKFQIRSGLIMGLGSFVTGFILLVFGLSFFQGNFSHDNIKFYIIYGSSLIAFLSLAIFCLGALLSHRVAGPIYALNRYLNDSCQRKKFPLKLRENDEFKELETTLTKLNSEMYRLYEIEKKYQGENTPPALPADVIPAKEIVKKAV